MVEVSGVKMDVKSARVDPEIEFQVESVEKDVSAGVEEHVAEKAQEKLSPRDTTTGSEKFKVDGAPPNVPVSQTIITSSARTELILLGEEKHSQSNTPGETTK